METNHSDLLGEVFPEVLESLAFMFADPADEADVAEAPEGALQASMRFTGPFEGTLRLAVSPAVCLEIAANVLGVDPDDEEAEGKSRDALKELLNITCGHVLTALAGEDPVFDLTVPEVAVLEPDAWAEFAGADDTARLLVDDSPILVQLSVDAG